VISCPEVVMRAGVMAQLVGYDRRLPHSADFYLWMLAATHGAVGRVNGSDQAFYRVHGNNMHLAQFAGALTDMRERWRTFELLFAEHGERLPNRQRLHDQVSRAMADDALRLACRAFDRGDTESMARLAEFQDFAERTCPRVRGGALWRALERRAVRHGDGLGPTRAQRLSAVADDLRYRVRWRRWRRYGV
jgi:hypothetical protein